MARIILLFILTSVYYRAFWAKKIGERFSEVHAKRVSQTLKTMEFIGWLLVLFYFD